MENPFVPFDRAVQNVVGERFPDELKKGEHASIYVFGGFSGIRGTKREEAGGEEADAGHVRKSIRLAAHGSVAVGFADERQANRREAGRTPETRPQSRESRRAAFGVDGAGEDGGPWNDESGPTAGSEISPRDDNLTIWPCGFSLGAFPVPF